MKILNILNEAVDARIHDAVFLKYGVNEENDKLTLQNI